MSSDTSYALRAGLVEAATHEISGSTEISCDRSRYLGDVPYVVMKVAVYFHRRLLASKWRPPGATGRIATPGSLALRASVTRGYVCPALRAASALAALTSIRFFQLPGW